jgi:hypothetical protein
MSTPIYNRGNLRPTQIAMLRRVLEVACLNRQVDPDSDDGKELALTLLALFNAGMVDEVSLTDAVAFPL